MPPNRPPVLRSNRPITIVLTGGGSGGHITPLLSLAHALKRQKSDCQIVYIGLKGEKVEGLEDRYKAFDATYFIPSGKFRRYHGESWLRQLTDFKTLWLNARDFFRVLSGVKAAKQILKKTKPSVVFSKGGFVVVPVGIAAHRLSIPIITHDSDAVPGLANRIIGRYAALHATGMPASNYSYPKDSIEYVGIPIDERIKPVGQTMQSDFKKELDLPGDSLVLLVGGAGLGSRNINQKIAEVAPRLLKQNPKLYILHVTGGALETETAEIYKNKLGDEELKRVKVVGFTPDFYKYSGAADLVITRAGATVLAELAVQKKPVILIPAGFLTGGHQVKNAESYERSGAAVVVADDAEAEKLLAVVNDLLNNPEQRNQLADKIGLRAKPDAAKKLAELILERTSEAKAQ